MTLILPFLVGVVVGALIMELNYGRRIRKILKDVEEL